jgi:RNA polymerase sigma-70 factor, ECF subfamily
MQRNVPTAAADDLVLLRRIGAGDRTAMKALYDAHSDALHRFLASRLGDAFEAADVAQETFLEVWRRPDRFGGRSRFRTWLFGIARNKAIDRIRKSRRTFLAEPDECAVDDAPNPEDVAVAASEAALVRACIAKLSDAHRSAIHLAFYGEFRYEEIAEIEGAPVGTIKTRILHAKRLLMHCLQRRPT